MSLLVKSEGGEAEEIIDEESGILISAMLRQYFMALRTVGKWRNLADHWINVATECSSPLAGLSRQTTTDSAVDSSHEAPSKPWADFLHSCKGVGKPPMNDDESDDETDKEDEAPDDRVDFELLLMRKFWIRWAQRAGVCATLSDPLDESEYMVYWTRTIAPVLEERIKMVQTKGD